MSDTEQIPSHKEVGVQTSPSLQAVDRRVDSCTSIDIALEDSQLDQSHSRSLSLPDSFKVKKTDTVTLLTQMGKKETKEFIPSASLKQLAMSRYRQTRSKPSLTDLRLPFTASSSAEHSGLRYASTPTYYANGDVPNASLSQEITETSLPLSSFSRRIASDPQPRDRTSSIESSNYATSSTRNPDTSVTTDDLYSIKDHASSVDSPIIDHPRTPSPEDRSASQTPDSIIFVNNTDASIPPSFLHAISVLGAVQSKTIPKSEVAFIATPSTPPQITGLGITSQTVRHTVEPDWITWTNSPPKPIPALHGPPSLPYARCPSGAEGVMFSESNVPQQTVWGIGAQPFQAPDNEPQPEYLDMPPETRQNPQLSESRQRNTAIHDTLPKKPSVSEPRFVQNPRSSMHNGFSEVEESKASPEYSSWPNVSRASQPNPIRYPDWLRSLATLSLHGTVLHDTDHPNPFEDSELEWAYMEEQLRPLYAAEQQRRIWLEEEQRRRYFEEETRRFQEEERQRRILHEQLIRRDELIRSIQELTASAQKERVPSDITMSSPHQRRNDRSSAPRFRKHNQELNLQSDPDLQVPSPQVAIPMKRTNTATLGAPQPRSRRSSEELVLHPIDDVHATQNSQHQIQPRGPPPELTTAGIGSSGVITGRRNTVSVVSPSPENFASTTSFSRSRHRYTKSLDDSEKYANNLANPRSIPLARLAGKIARPTLLDEIPEEAESPAPRTNAIRQPASYHVPQFNDLGSVLSPDQRRLLAVIESNPDFSSFKTSLTPHEAYDPDEDWSKIPSVDASPSAPSFAAVVSSTRSPASGPSAGKKPNRPYRKGGKKQARTPTPSAGQSVKRDETAVKYSKGSRK